jgi:hypothetical protein
VRRDCAAHGGASRLPIRAALNKIDRWQRSRCRTLETTSE